MNSLISKALSEGFSNDDILKYLMKKFPHYSNKIQQAITSGFSIDQIVKFLSGGKKELARHQEPITEFQQMTERGIQRRQNIEKTALGATALAAAPIAAPMAQAALQRALPPIISSVFPAMQQGIKSLSQQILPENIQQTEIKPQDHLQNIPQQPPGNEPIIPQQALPAQPEQKIIDPTALLSKHGLLKHVEELSKKQKDPKAIAGILYSKYPKEMKEFQKESGKNMEDAIGDYLQSKPQEMIKPEEEKPTISKKETVATPQGIGEIKEIRNGKALVEVEGKKHVVDEDELIQSPLPEKELSDLYEDLISGIEKKSGKQISRNVEWAGYDPKTNELAYKPHGSDKLYAYDNISPEDVELLTSLLTQRKSTGENFIGAWEAGTESPIGAAMYQLIRKLQSERGGKGSEYKNRYETIYDALELAKKALKEKHAERKKKAKKPRID